jgi:glycosyltransferase involved in cell wall biosynthesis
MSAVAPPQRVLIVHNRYQQKGGEDSVVDAEVALLRGHGHEVSTYIRSNDELNGTAAWRAAANALWSGRAADELRQAVSAAKADVVHVHNTFPVLSPSVYWAAQFAGVPVVQTLHNFRLACPQAMFLRDGKVCEDCLGHVPWRAVQHRCYRGSMAQSAVSAAVLVAHRALGTYANKIDRFVALNNFCRDKFIEMGLPAHKIVVKPNFIDPVAAPLWEGRAGGLFVGRLSAEKGIATLLEALKLAPEVVLRVAGTGEHEPAVRAALEGTPHFLGFQPLNEVVGWMRKSAFLVVPSIWYENFPRTIVEAYSVGLPVIASRIGALPELIEDGRTGLLAAPGDAQDLAEKLRWAQAHPEAMLEMGRNALRKFEAEYSAARNYSLLRDIYSACSVRTR